MMIDHENLCKLTVLVGIQIWTLGSAHIWAVQLSVLEYAHLGKQLCVFESAHQSLFKWTVGPEWVECHVRCCGNLLHSDKKYSDTAKPDISPHFGWAETFMLLFIFTLDLILTVADS